jgi:hypothetical protein
LLCTKSLSQAASTAASERLRFVQAVFQTQS